jgi:hypothetical protein
MLLDVAAFRFTRPHPSWMLGIGTPSFRSSAVLISVAFTRAALAWCKKYLL